MEKITKLKSILTLIVLTIIVLAHQNCTYNIGGNSHSATDLPDLDGLSEGQISSVQAKILLEEKCISCHNPLKTEGEISDILNTDLLLYYRFIIPSEPQLSPIYTQVAKGQCPPGGGVTSEDVQVLYDWIAKGIVEEESGIAPPAAVTGPLEPKWSSIFAKIIQPKCLGCHNSVEQRGGLVLTTYAFAMNVVQPNDLAASALYQETLAGNMPQNGSPLSPGELAAIRQWIESGAPNN